MFSQWFVALLPCPAHCRISGNKALLPMWSAWCCNIVVRICHSSNSAHTRCVHTVHMPCTVCNVHREMFLICMFLVCRVQQGRQAAQWGLLGCKETRATGDQQGHRHVEKCRQQPSTETVACRADSLVTLAAAFMQLSTL
jgi:hypothetical protein